MPGVPSPATGLLRDLPDFRDWTLASPTIRESLAKLRRRRSPRSAKPAQVDWREFILPAPELHGLRAASAAAVLGLVQYFDRRAVGHVAEGSTMFLYRTARRLEGIAGDNGVGLRSTLKALVRFGCPPERHYSLDPARFDLEPESFAYGFQREYAELHYVRLDPPSSSGSEVLQTLKSCLAAGFACVGGTVLTGDAGTDGEIAYPTRHDEVAGATAVVVVGYDDSYRIRSTKGALRIRTTPGLGWGEHGYGYLPYRYVEERLAFDFWTLAKPQWLASGEFEQPV